MNVLLRSKVGRRFLGMFLLLFLPVIAAGWFGLRKATEALGKETHSVLRTASDGAEAQLREYLLSLKKTTETLASEEAVRSCLKSPNQTENLSRLLQKLRARVPEAREIFCIDLDGRVVASSSPQTIGEDRSGSVEFARGRRSFYPGDVVRDGKSGGLQWEMGAPVNESGHSLGVVVLAVAPNALSDLTTGNRALAEGADTQSFRIGETGETYIVNRNHLLVTESRFVPEAILRLKVETEPVRAAFDQGQEIIGDYRDYRGVPVSGASAVISDMGWVLITEVDFRQAFAPLVRLRKALIWMAAGICLFGGLIGIRFARGILDPLEMVGRADRALAQGEEEASLVPEAGLPPNEIGEFVQKRNFRVRELFNRQRQLVKEQQARAEAAADLQRLAYSMVHDMRAPLRAITSFGDLLEADAGDRLGAPEHEYLNQMRRSALRMDKLICDMLKYSSLLMAEVPLSAVDVAELARSLLDAKPALRERKPNIQLEGRIPPVIGNGGLLTQCFSAMLDNAFRYTRPEVEPKVILKADTREHRVVISLEDNGTGMPKEFQERVFGIFQKGTHSSEGTGIGLALVRVAVERMGGRVGVQSQEGQGSRFWIELEAA